MELGEKVKQLRKESNLTQEQLAEKLFVSRTAVSKWESGKGYPNIESLKSLAKIFSVSIDELLSNEELIEVAENEAKNNKLESVCLIFGLLDISLLACIFLPFYGIKHVSLIAYQTIMWIKVSYFAIIILLGLVGLAEIFLYYLKAENLMSSSRFISIGLHSLGILFFTMSREPYMAAYFFMLLGIKLVLLFRSK